MANYPDMRDQAYQFFLEEAPELLQSIEAGLLKLRQERDVTEIHEIMRAAHSLKGGAASVGLEPIKAIAHRLEALFKALYSETVTIDDQLEVQLLQAFDCLRLPLIDQLTQGSFDADQALGQAEPVFQQLEAQLAAAIIETENFIPSASDFGLDIAKSIFETDVQQGLDDLAYVLEQEDTEVAGALRAQAEIFIGFAELLELSGFAQIAETALQALDNHPERAIEITRLAITDFRQGRAAVLEEKSATGGAPSSELLALAAGITEAGQEAEAIASAPIWPDSENALSEIAAFDWSAQATEPNMTLASAAAADIPDRENDELAAIFTAEERGSILEDFFAPPAASEPVAAEPSSAPETSTDHASEGEKLQPELPASPEIAVTLPSNLSPLLQNFSVRVDTQRLARLDNQLGELTINRNALSLQTDQMRLGLKALAGRFERVRSTVEQLQAVSDQILIAPERQRPAIAASSTASQMPVETAEPPEFDSLEMDTYTALYTYSQTLLEDMVQFEEAAADMALFNRQSEQLLNQHHKMLAQVQDDLMYARMVPLSQVLNRFPRTLRDLSNTYGKPAELTLEGAELLIDKAVLEKLYDPLLHILRNGFDHGLESPDERRQQGKPETGQIAIRAHHRGRQIVIEVQDDGRGLDLGRVRQRVIDQGWMTSEEIQTASAEQLSRYIFEPGFSTAEQVSDLSGRGVGLDVVREQLQLLKGTVAVQSTAGQGTRFTLSLPMTLSIMNLLVCFVGSTPIAFRSDGIREILVPQPQQLSEEAGLLRLKWQEQLVPVYRLNDLLTYACLLPEMPLSRVLAAVPSPADWEDPLLILSQGEQAFAIQVSSLITEQESVIKPFGSVLTPPPYAYGCTVLGDGSLIPVIDGQAFLDDLVRRSLAKQSVSDAAGAIAAIATQNREANRDRLTPLQQATTVMVVDDAVTSRRTLALSLERSGYRVLQARDGQEALEQLAQNSAVKLIICDIEMPNMNGFDFLTQRRQDPAIAQIPTFMLTSRSNDKHRWLAKQLGATDYFTKPYLEQEFIQAIVQQLKEV